MKWMNEVALLCTMQQHQIRTESKHIYICVIWNYELHPHSIANHSLAKHFYDYVFHDGVLYVLNYFNIVSSFVARNALVPSVPK